SMKPTEDAEVGSNPDELGRDKEWQVLAETAWPDIPVSPRRSRPRTRRPTPIPSRHLQHGEVTVQSLRTCRSISPASAAQFFNCVLLGLQPAALSGGLMAMRGKCITL